MPQPGRAPLQLAGESQSLYRKDQGRQIGLLDLITVIPGGLGTRKLRCHKLANIRLGPVTLPEPAKQVVVSRGVSCALTKADSVYCWGANEFGQTGNTSRDSCQMPNGHFDTISDPCNVKPVPVLGLSIAD